MRCHHLDPRVLSYLPSEVSDQIENDIIGKSRFSFGKVQQSKCFLLAFENISLKAKVLSGIVSKHFLKIILSIEILPLSCATFSSIENATECADCVSG